MQDEKTPEQCRSHAQKYFKNLENLLESLKKVSRDEKAIQEDTHIKIQTYEDECKKVIESLKKDVEKTGNQNLLNWHLFPAYLQDQRLDKIVQVSEKYKDIIKSIENEFKHYDMLKNDKRI
jgi:hypothetical protein